MDIKAGQIWKCKKFGVERLVTDVSDGYVSIGTTMLRNWLFLRDYEFVRNKGDAQVIYRTDMEAAGKSFLDCMSKLAGMLPKTEDEDEDDVMDKCGKCGSGITLLDKAASGEREVSLCSPCLHQDNLKRKREAEAKKPTVVVGVRRHKDEQPDLSLSAAIKKFEQGKLDMVNQPPHYKDASGIECKEITCHRKMPFSLGNAIKYLYRAGSKGDLLEDLKKAEWYLRVAYLNSELLPVDVVRRLSEVAAVRKTEAGKALNLLSRHQVLDAYRVVKSEIEQMEKLPNADNQ